MSVNQPTCPGGTYTIQAGDTLWNISQELHIPLDALQRANPGIDPNALRVGQVICLPTPVQPPGPAPRWCGPGTYPYTVRAGDTVYLVAQRMGTTVEAILRLNPGLDPNALRVGETICTPLPPSTVNCPTGLARYYVQPGDTLFVLAQKTGTTVERILAQNPGLNPNNLSIGQIICLPPAPATLPAPAPAPSGCRRYVIQPGDTFYLVGRRFGVSVAALEQANPGVNANNLLPGRVICVPNP